MRIFWLLLLVGACSSYTPRKYDKGSEKVKVETFVSDDIKKAVEDPVTETPTSEEDKSSDKGSTKTSESETEDEEVKKDIAATYEDSEDTADTAFSFPPFPFMPPWIHMMFLRQIGMYPPHRGGIIHRPAGYLVTINDQDEATEQQVEHGRARRSALSSYKKSLSLDREIEVRDSDEWWYDIDGGETNAVSEELREDHPGYGAAAMWREAMDHWAPAIHLGEIDTGYERNPYLAKASDRTFGQGADFNAEDYAGFAFQPTGERYTSMVDFVSMAEQGSLPVGRKFIMEDFATESSVCWETILPAGLDSDDEMLNLFDLGRRRRRRRKRHHRRDDFWFFFDCSRMQDGVYTLVGYRSPQFDEETEFGDGGDYEYVFFLRSESNAKMVAMTNINPFGVRDATPLRTNYDIYVAEAINYDPEDPDLRPPMQ